MGPNFSLKALQLDIEEGNLLSLGRHCPHSEKHMSVDMLRKLASSLNFFQFMNFKDLAKMTGWKSNRVFYRHYLANIENISLPVVAAGKVIPPS